MFYPYDDDIMVYDKERHMYVLTENGILQKLGINLGLEFSNSGSRANRAQRFLQKVSDTVYGYIYEDSSNSLWLEYVLARLPACRAVVEEMLLDQAEYSLSNNFLSDFSGVNIAKGTAMKRENLRGNIRVAQGVELACKRDIHGLWHPLKTALFLPTVPPHEFRRRY